MIGRKTLSTLTQHYIDGVMVKIVSERRKVCAQMHSRSEQIMHAVRLFGAYYMHACKPMFTLALIKRTDRCTQKSGRTDRNG